MNWFLAIYIFITAYFCICCYFFGKVDGKNEAFDFIEKEWRNNDSGD
jgi:hypothetical protein